MRAQNVDAVVESFVDRMEKGDTEEAKKSLPDLAARYPNSPAVMYLQGRLTQNGVEAAKSYQSIVDNFPHSQWTDDALYALYQFHYTLGHYRTADQKLQQLRREYPDSPLLSLKHARSIPERGDDTVSLPTKEIASAETTKQVSPDVQPVTEPYTLQLGAFSSVKNAENQKNLLEEMGVNVEVTNKVRGGRSLYLVWAGSFATSAQARAFGQKIKDKYKVDSIIVEKY
jgi:cell division septation protein DedD